MRTVERFDAAVLAVARSSSEMMDVLASVRADKPWETDDDFKAERAREGSRLVPDADGSWMRQWCEWRAEYVGAAADLAGRRLHQLAAAGELRNEMSCTIVQDDLPVTEGSMRPLVELANKARWLPSERKNRDDDDLRAEAVEAVADAYRTALVKSEGDRSAAAKATRRYVKATGYQPLIRGLEPSTRERQDKREAAKAKAIGQMRDGFAHLLKAGQMATIRELLDEMEEAWTRAR